MIEHGPDGMTGDELAAQIAQTQSELERIAEIPGELNEHERARQQRYRDELAELEELIQE